MNQIHVVRYWDCEIVTHLNSGKFEVRHKGQSKGEHPTLARAVVQAKALSFPATEDIEPEETPDEDNE